MEISLVLIFLAFFNLVVLIKFVLIKKRVCWQWRTHLFAEEMNKKHKIFYLAIFIFLWLLRSAQPCPESCLTIWSFNPSCLLIGCLLKKSVVPIYTHAYVCACVCVYMIYICDKFLSKSMMYLCSVDVRFGYLEGRVVFYYDISFSQVKFLSWNINWIKE